MRLFLERFDFSELDEIQRRAALREVSAIRAGIGHFSPELARELERLAAALESGTSRPLAHLADSDPRHPMPQLHRLLRMLAPLALAAGSAIALPAAAASPLGTLAVGDEVYNPDTNANEIVIEVTGDPVYSVRTSSDRLILLAQEVGDSFADAGTSEVYTVIAVTTDGDGDVTSVTLQDSSLVSTSVGVVDDFSTAEPSVSPSYGSTSFPTASANVNNVDDYRKGDNGSNGDDGGAIISASKGEDGKKGPTFSRTINAGDGPITTTSNDLPGIYVASKGGDGGKGGDGYLGAEGKKGGAAGNGGDVTLTNHADIATTGTDSHGILVQSVAGKAGKGGSGYIFSSGGGGGSAAEGGAAAGYNTGDIHTTGAGAGGLIVQSLGGDAGKGGSSYGIVGKAGDGSEGGDGGTAYAQTSGIIVTEGEYGHGVMAQSLGGNGGNSGASGGIAAFGGDGGRAGNGGAAEILATSTSETVTKGDYAHGLFAQSVGGGGGSGRGPGGVYAIGGDAGSGGTGSTAKVTAQDGAYVETQGTGAYGIFAQSVGGNGGTAGGVGGVVAVGGTGGGGNNAGAVTINSGATVITSGDDSRGIFAQSVGGGGGDANASGGVVSLGGDGDAGGNGGAVSVTLSSYSFVKTTGDGADAVFAQSLGGGGGSGAGSGGVVSIGGKGDSGGSGSTVSVSNAGYIATEGDRSRGLFAQSVGGGGGSGGGGGGLIGIGGDGSVASNGGNVTVSNSGVIRTEGDVSTALQAQSLGGGGGDGGNNGGAFYTIGGSGDGGGEGGDVSITHSGIIQTEGHDSHGIFGQSVGGGGGNGGSVESGSLFGGVAIGGDGAGGGDGGDVSVTFTNRTVTIDSEDVEIPPLVTTEGDRSRGVFIQSLGGGGGNGGHSIQITGGFVAAVSVALGGSGDGGGTGGTASIDGDVNVVTQGENSEGIFAQSVGGGGGAGGYSVAGSISLGIGASASVSVGIGGSGGSGGNGGTVDIDSGGSIVTYGNYSTGLVAQSVGGGGGKGGFNISAALAGSDTVALAVPVGIGGSGGSGGNGGTVDATFDGAIYTGGDDAAGALIQSTGGGGGAGGFNVSGAVTLSGAVAAGVAVGLGGSGGGGGNGGTVTGVIGGPVRTEGDRSAGVIIQSEGGGGGVGGFDIAGTVEFGGNIAGGVSVGLGGSGGSGGNGGTVSGTVNGPIATYGDQSDGLLVQSLGGGGGSGGFNISGNIALSGTVSAGVSVGLGGAGGGGGNGGAVTAVAGGDIYTEGDQSRGFVAQSEGGGGGAGAFNVSGDITLSNVGGAVGVGLGGTGGSGGSSAAVDATAASITTKGDDSAAFIAQSLGGGGGVGGFNVTGGIAFSGTAGGTIGVGIGGKGGSGGGAGTVDATIDGEIYTEGDSSGGILAQSVGGGGGGGGFNITGGITASGTGGGSINVGIGGAGAGGGDGKAVTLDLTGSSTTKGDGSDAIVVQSLGGGGGAGAFNISGGLDFAGTGAGSLNIGIGGSGAGGGKSGAVTLTVNDGTTDTDTDLVAAYTEGDRSNGIVIQSEGGGGGVGGFNISGGLTFAGEGSGVINVGIGGSGGGGGNGAAVSADISGATITRGEHSTGILAQSVGGGGGAGGFNISGGIAGAGTGAGTLSVGIGGSGGDGGDGAGVTLAINDEVTAPTADLIAAYTSGDRSDGIVVQSLGGGGGTGGFNISGGISFTGSFAGNLNVGIGGSGGDGGDGAAVSADITGAIVTKGDESTGLLVQSVGGGGGAGGFNINGGIAGASDFAANVGFGMGGTGGDGGHGGAVTLSLNENIDDSGDTLVSAMTEGDDSAAIVVQSLGGGGGTGGMVVEGDVAFASSGAGNLGIGVGGKGGGGGNSGAVSATINGDIVTKGDRSGGLLVQSEAGGGGAGGFSIVGGISASKDLSGNILVGIGGAGGNGGNASTVNTTLTGDISTEGEGSYGATVQSLGGSGGVGAFNITGGITMAFGETGAGNIGVGVGGFGGDGGNSAAVRASLTGAIDTLGDGAYGALIQSVGGGGGAGGFNVTGGISASRGTNGSLGFGLGGFGGGGGNAGTVNATLDGDVSTDGDDAFGALVQSLGGAGGAGGFDIVGNVSLTSSKDSAAIAASIGIGGFGGSAGDGEAVTADITGLYVTTGDNADGIMVQSLGGSGGAGGFNIAGSVVLGNGTSGTAAVGIGGFGGDGGNGAAVSLTRTGDTYTTGALSDGIVVQSAGGGGGSGGFDITGNLAVSTEGSAGSFGFGLGGFGGGGGNAGDVSVDVTGSVLASGYGTETERTDLDFEVLGEALTLDTYRTRDDGSNGLLAQSFGGGGGVGGFNISGALTMETSNASGSSGRLAQIGVGGFGGAGGNAGAVDVTVAAADDATERAQLQAAGDGTIALGAQSIGGGGGAGAFNITGGISSDGQFQAGVGGFGGDGGTAGNVTVDVDADIFASGNHSSGLTAQSIGGGGGAGAFNITGGIVASFVDTTEPAIAFGVGGFAGDGNDAGTVTVEQNGQVMVDGFDTHGILVQSIGGGGGAGGMNVTGLISGSGGTKRIDGFSLGVGLGGYGGTGADGAAVSLRSNGNIFVNTVITTGTDPDSGDDVVTFSADEYGAMSPGILVQSIGGGGGSGGLNATGVVAPKGSPLSIGIGGTGGAGGDSDDVTVIRGYTFDGTDETSTPGLIMTFGDGSSGLVAQSISGGGGNAGINAVGGFTVAASATDAVAAVVAVGGSGGDGGNSGDVSVTHNGDIQTDGFGSNGILAQSMTNGGGSGTFNIGTGYFSKAASINIAVGGSGGNGGVAGDVFVDHSGVISTGDDMSAGIVAQSLGRGGGDASFDFANSPFAWNQVSLSWGALGGTGGQAGDVTVQADGTILTEGEESSGIIAQSIGGAGGASGSRGGGIALTTGTGSEQTGYSANVSVGLEGGEGGVAGKVDVDNSADIATQGDKSRGILAQSIGGDGGTGGSATGLLINVKYGASVAIGGAGGTGAIADTVDVENEATITTEGEKADGILAQSIGGGGGAGGMAATLGWTLVAGTTETPSNTVSVAVGGLGGVGSTGSTVTVNNFGTIATSGEEAYGIRAQSIGGGGGVGGAVLHARLIGAYSTNSLDVNIGGGGGEGETGGNVAVLNEGLIYTTGRDAAGISANSIGGGGGDAGIVLDAIAGGTFKTDTHRIVVNIGGAGGNGAQGGDVSVINQVAAGAADDDLSGVIVTEGKGAYGIFAQSIGGGGGNSSSILSVSALGGSAESLTAGFNFGNIGGNGAKAGSVEVDNSGVIQTAGDGAHGIFAQSLGGGGGNGGMVLAGNFLIAPTVTAPLVALGGLGGDGGDGGSVTVDNSGSILTMGDHAHGILAQSIGGGGGNASMGFAATTEPITLVASNAFSAILGATGGGTGGTGGEVTVNHSGDITVLGDGSEAIKAQSINGGGGGLELSFDGFAALPGLSYFGSSGPAEAPDALVAARAGADGASGMNAGKVTVNSTGNITVGGDGSSAISIDSIGGGGGTISLDFTIVELDESLGVDQSPVTFDVALGGTDGDDNSGGDLEENHAGEVMTLGDSSPGATIQTVGGGGGQLFATIQSQLEEWFGGFVATLGGSNGSNSLGGSITHTQDGFIGSLGDFSPGAILQSIGGGGGFAFLDVQLGDELSSMEYERVALDSGTKFPADHVPVTFDGGFTWLTLGADGGTGNDGGAIDTGFAGGFETVGDHSPALVIQSIGAGGGTAFVLTDNAPHLYIGGYNGAEGSGGAVILTNDGAVITGGTGSHGIIAQSIGGGGGVVFGEFVDPAIVLSDDNSGDGGAVSLTQTGDVGIFGDQAMGLIVQSIGGGGGFIDGYFAGTAGGEGSGGAVTAALDGSMLLAGADATGIFAQSIGPDGSGAVSVAVGGSIEADGDNSQAVVAQSIAGTGGWIEGEFVVTPGDQPAGAVAVAIEGSIAMLGETSTGVIAQSVGASGGAVSAELDGSLMLAGADSTGLLLQSLGTGGAGDVSAAVGGSIEADGDNSQGIVAQSIADSGPTGAVDVAVDGSIYMLGASSTGVTAQSIGAIGGDVSILLDGSLLLAGADSTGFLAQSSGTDGAGAVSAAIGGSIEADGDNSTAIMALSTTDSGPAGAVSVSVDGSIMMLGAQSTGVFAESSGTTGGAVTIGLAGPIYAAGLDNVGVYARSTGATGNGDIEITAAGAIRGGDGTGTAIRIVDGGDNLVTSTGMLSAVSGLAMQAGAGNDTLDNYGLVFGNLELGGGTNVVFNREGASFVTIDTLDLADGAGSSGTFTNEGELFLGQSADPFPLDFANGETFPDYVSSDPANDPLYGTQIISQVALDGDFVQTASGVSYWDIAFGPYASDRIDATGDATVEGQAVVVLTWLEDAEPVPLVTTGGTGTDLGLEVADTIALDFKIIDGSDGIYLGYDSRFGQDFLTRNGRALGEHIDSALAVGGAGGIGRLLTLLGSLTEGQEDLYAAIFAELDPESYLAPTVEQFDAARAFGDGLFGCDTYRGGDPRGCIWGKVATHGLDREAATDAPQFEVTGATRARLGGGVPLGGGWSVGVALGYDDIGDIAFDTDRAVGDGEAFHAGLGIRKSFGAGAVSLALTGGWQDSSMAHRQTVFEAGTGTADLKNSYLGATANVEYEFGLGDVFIRPALTASYIRLTQDAFEETGLDGLGVAGDRHSQWIATATPKISVGVDFTEFARLTLTGGAVVHDSDAIAHPFRLLGADPATDPALIRTRIDAEALLGEARLEIFGSDRLRVDLGYRGEFGKTVDAHEANIALKLAF